MPAQVTAGLLFLMLAAIAIMTWRNMLTPVVGDLNPITMNRSSLVAMPKPRSCHREPWMSVQPPFFDGVIVPSARGAENIRRAIGTARNAGSYLIVIASGRTVVADVEQLLSSSDLARDKCLVLDRARLASANRLRLRTFDHPLASTANDLSEKKNAGLHLARLMGWQSVLFVDDDIQSIGRTQLKDAAGLLAGADRAGTRRRLVGWAIDEFPDFSSVGYARSYGTGESRTFVSGGAMALRCDSRLPFFPPVYNEDMLLGLEIMHGDREAACVVGTLSQDEYDPFGDLHRVVEQEFGEVMVEGLDRATSLADATRPEFWKPVLLDRLATLSQVSRRLHELGVHNGVRVVEVARGTHRADWPALLADFVTDWVWDLAAWREFQRRLPVVTELSSAAAVLGSCV
jgi:hypothetical protein